MNERSLNVVSIQSLNWESGIEYSLRAIRELVLNGLRVSYDLVGQGIYMEAVSFCIYQMRIDYCVTIHEDAAHWQTYLNWADIVLDASVRYKTNVILRQAVAAGKPIVCTDVFAQDEILLKSERVSMVPRRNSNALCASLAGVAESLGFRNHKIA